MERMIAFICERKRKGRQKVSSPMKNITFNALSLSKFQNREISKKYTIEKRTAGKKRSTTLAFGLPLCD